MTPLQYDQSTFQRNNNQHRFACNYAKVDENVEKKIETNKKKTLPIRRYNFRKDNRKFENSINFPPRFHLLFRTLCVKAYFRLQLITGKGSR